jgi:hypothetical protein
VPDSTWNPPTGPPNSAPLRPAEARRELADALDAARARDRELRAELVALATARVQARDRLAAASDEAAESRTLGKRALTRSNQSARDGQRADAAKLTAAARVFAMRLRDARARVASLERQLAAQAERAQRAEAALSENVGRLQAVAAARLPALSGRRAARAEREIDEVVVAISAPADDQVAMAAEAARTAADEALLAGPGGEVEVAPVTDDELESEVDLEGADEVLDELRAELGLGPVPDPVDAPSPAGGQAAGPDPAAAHGGTEATPGSATAPGSGTPRGTATPAGDAAPPVPAARR